MTYKNLKQRKIYLINYRKTSIAHRLWLEKTKEKRHEYGIKWRENRLGRPRIRERTNPLDENLVKPSFSLGYILGVLYGDGYIYIKNYQGIFGLEVTDLDFVENFKTELSKIYPYAIKINTRIRKEKNRKQLYVVCINSLAYAKFFNNFNIFDLINMEEDIVCGFLKGFFDSEGCVHAYNLDNPKIAHKAISLTQKNYDWIILVQNLLKKLGIESTIVSKIGSGFNPLGEYYILTICKHQNLKIFRDKIGLSIKRKIEKLNLILTYFIIEKQCLYCGKTFSLRKNNQIFCSKKCCLKQGGLNNESRDVQQVESLFLHPIVS